MTTYFQVQEAIHVISAGGKARDIEECSDNVYNNIYKDGYLLQTADLLPDLSEKIRLLIYNGQFDVICNHVGNK